MPPTTGRVCNTEGCQRLCRPGYANCDADTSRLIAEAFGEARAVPVLPVRRLSRLTTNMKGTAT